MRGGKTFIDTNVLLYMHDESVPEKSRICSEWMTALARRKLALINLQTLNELTHVLLRKQWYSDVQTVFQIIDRFAALGATPLSGRDIVRARQIRMRCGYAWWDCLLLASALELGCSHFLSEDLQDGQKIEDLTIIDPFAHSPAKIL